MKKIIVSKKAKELLKKTIDEKWKLVLSGKILERGRVNCYLCQAFIQCKDCPIPAKTGLDSCRGTPYRSWVNHQKDFHNTVTRGTIQCPACKRIATQEINFLEALYEECEIEE